MNCANCGSQNNEGVILCANCGKPLQTAAVAVPPQRLKQNVELRTLARAALKGKWLNPVLVSLIFIAIGAGIQVVPIIGTIAYLVIAGPLVLGSTMYFLAFSRMQEPGIEKMFEGFHTFSSALCLFLLIGLFTLLWSLLLIVPGIIAAFRYSMSFYIMADSPQISASEAMEQSKKMMYGHKSRLFCLIFSFIGWGILCCLTFGIGFLWLCPYMQVTVAKFYEDLKANAQ